MIISRTRIAFFLVFTLLIGSIAPAMTSGFGTPHVLNGYVKDANSNPIMGVTVFINNTRTSSSINYETDYMGRYYFSIEVGVDYLVGDVLNITAVYGPYNSTDNLTINSEPVQQLDFNLSLETHIISGSVFKPDGSTASYYTVNVSNEDKGNNDYCLTNISGQYRKDICLYPDGYDEDDEIVVSVLYDGFSGSNSSIVSSNNSDEIDVHLADIEMPQITIFEAPSNITLNSDFRIIARVTDNTIINHASIFIKNPGDIIFTELAMIQDDGALNDWDSDNMIDINLFGQSTLLDIPSQSGIGAFEYYFMTDDGVFTATLPPADPENNAYEIQVLDIIEPTLAHMPITSLEASQTSNIIAIAEDNIELDEIIMHVKGVGQSVFTEYLMQPNGIPAEFNATMPAQSVLGTLEYFLTCNDTSNNSVRLPESGSWPVNVVDTTAPVITHSIINSVNVNDPVNFTCQVSEFVGLDKVWLNFTDVHGAGFNVSMNNTDSGNWYYQNISGMSIIGSGQLYYRIWANDTSGNLASITHIAAVNDIGTPLIFHDAPEYLDYDVMKNISAYVEDDSNIANVHFAYEPVGGTGFIVMDMTSTDSDGKHGNYSVEIPPQAIGILKYYINATDDGTNNISWPALNPYYELDVRDYQSPEISGLNYSASRLADTPAPVKVNVSDNHLIGSVILYYLNTTSPAWIPVNMNHIGSGQFQASIPAHGPGAVKFYISANDSSENNATHPIILPRLNPFYVNFVDGIMPEVGFFMPAAIGVNQTASVLINITDDQEPSLVQLFYNGTEDTGFSALSVSKLGPSKYECILPAQNLSGEIQLYSVVSDGMNTNQTQIHSILVINQPREILQTGVDSAPVNENVAFIAQVTDDLAVLDVQFYWRAIGETQYESRKMNTTISEIYSVNLFFSEPIIIQYHIIANDAENSTTWPEGPDHEISIMDLDAPVIVHNPPEQLNVSSTPIFTASVTDNQQVSSVNIWYKNSTASTFFSAVMLPVSNMPDTFTAVLDPQPEGNFTYYIEATDGINIVETEHYSIEVLDNSGTDWTAIIMLLIVIILLVIASIIILLRRKPIKQGVNPQEK